MKMAVVGCPRNCAEAYVKDVGVVAVGNGKWEVYVGGAAGASVRKGDLLATVSSPEEVPTHRPVPAVLPRTPTGWSAPTTSCPASGWTG